MKIVKFEKEFSFAINDRVTKTWPAGWPLNGTGEEIPTAAAYAARRAGAAVFAGEDAEKLEAAYQQFETDAKAAKESEAAKLAAESKVVIPDDWKNFNAAETVDLAKHLGAADDVTTKAAASDFIAAEVAKRGALL